MSVSRPVLALALSAVVGCAQNHATGIGASREPLGYDGRTFRQGRTPIDEHDFYRIAGERDVANAIAEQRDRGIRYNRAGLVLLGLGLVGPGAMATTDGAMRKLGTGFMLALPIGGVMTFYGRSKAEQRPIESYRRASVVRDRRRRRGTPRRARAGRGTRRRPRRGWRARARGDSTGGLRSTASVRLGVVSACLDSDELSAWIAGSLSAAARTRAIEHVAECTACRQAVAGLAAVATPPERVADRPDDGLDLAPGMQLGRFTVERVLGRGGMGVVIAARDPALDRAVAIKVLPADAAADGALDARLAREAKVLAQVRHPNLVGVLETGVDRGRRYVVMELIAASTTPPRRRSAIC